MKTGKKKIIVGMKDWTKKKMVEEDEKLNKVRIAKKKKNIYIYIYLYVFLRCSA